MSYYRPRVSNRTLSGAYAHLIGKQVTWEENDAPAAPDSQWEPASGKVVVVGEDGVSFYVQDKNNCRRWIDAQWNIYRNVKIK